jgi:ergothioneine biosynthesis protein EgtB
MNDGVANEKRDDLRVAGKQALGQALQDARLRTLRLLDRYEAALGSSLNVPLSPIINPPRWEFGHVGWFADWWLIRNPDLARGLHADPTARRLPARQACRGLDADALYDSSAIAHDRRWSLTLPSAAETRTDLIDSLADALSCLEAASDDDQGLYFFRLSLFHEDMHAEAAAYTAQTLGFDSGCDFADGPPLSMGAAELTIAPAEVRLGYQGPGFCFDNELGLERIQTAQFQIDTRAVSWAQYVPFIDAGGYTNPRWWSEPGWNWRCSGNRSLPRYLRHGVGSAWERLQFGRWQPLNLATTVVHVSAFEAQAWCRWAQRRLPTEAEWVIAAQSTAQSAAEFEWGQVWEWTASAFQPFHGFVAHPYRDYSQPWFDGRPVLKGACAATRARMRNVQYRNFSPPERDDIFAGFRSVAL